MTAFNAVRFRVKPGMEDEFLEAHRRVERAWPGMRHANIIKTGDGAYCRPSGTTSRLWPTLGRR
jgi:hypothetical protein